MEAPVQGKLAALGRRIGKYFEALTFLGGWGLSDFLPEPLEAASGGGLLVDVKQCRLTFSRLLR